MIQITQLKLPPDHTQEDLRRAVRRKLRLREENAFSYTIRRQSVDARKKPQIFYVYTVDVQVPGEKKILGRLKADPNVRRAEKTGYSLPPAGDRLLRHPPLVIGSGPAGLFCALMLARAGFAPVLLERGGTVSERTGKVQAFWEGGPLDPECNVQFGEGGAGTFSDGKLNTMIRDPSGRIRKVYETFVRHGADPSILYSYKPHIGTDVLAEVIPQLREEIRQLGGQVLFHRRLCDIKRGTGESGWRAVFEITESGSDHTASSTGENGTKERMSRERTLTETMDTDVLVLAIGHSARDTFRMLHARGMAMEPKAFAVGVRVQHPQQRINDAMYGEDCPYEMDSAPYKLTASIGGRGVYSFCMCPGGYVINASSAEGKLAVNGMSTFARDSGNANSAIVVTVSPQQYAPQGAEDPLAGVRYQEDLERRAYEAGEGAIPTQRYADFKAGQTGSEAGGFPPRMKGTWRMADVRGILPEEIASLIEEAMEEFGKKITGFDDGDTLLSAVESRTSSPVRILRGESFESISHPGIYPCGEGAGYAGGITSAAVDGIRVAEQIIRTFNGDGKNGRKNKTQKGEGFDFRF